MEDVLMEGAVSLGDDTSSTPLLSINSQVVGMGFEGKGAGNGLSILMSPISSGGGSIALPDGGSGSIMTSGRLPTLQEVSVISPATFSQSVHALDHVTLGDPLQPHAVELRLALAGLLPLRFAGINPHSNQEKERETTLLVSPITSPVSLLMLPDASGTIQLSSNMPSTRRNASFEQRFQSSGGTIFDGKHLALGSPDLSSPLKVSLEHARLSTPDGLIFEASHGPLSGVGGSGASSIRVAIEEPSGGHQVRLPDQSGTVLTSAHLPHTPFHHLRLLQEVEVEGDVHMDVAHVEVGSRVSDEASYLSLHARLSGAYPLSFDCDLSPMPDATSQPNTKTRPRVCLSIHRPLSETQNTISFPDTSGTIITTDNLPNPLVSDSSYTLSTGFPSPASLCSPHLYLCLSLTCMQICVCIFIRVYTHTHTQTHKLIYLYTYIYI